MDHSNSSTPDSTEPKLYNENAALNDANDDWKVFGPMETEPALLRLLEGFQATYRQTTLDEVSPFVAPKGIPTVEQAFPTLGSDD